jgi:hypothetical protein
VPAAAPPRASSGYALASVDTTSLFSPYPTYTTSPSASAPVAQADSPPAARAAIPPAANQPTASAPSPSAPGPNASSRGTLPPQIANADDQIPMAALAYAAPAAEETAASAAGAAPPKRPSAPPHPAATSNAVLNNAQIASIKERLKLSSYQDQMWPPVEQALRDISWQRDPTGHKTGARAGIDPNSAPVQRLKSAAVPLIMSLSEPQKEEVRTMVRLLGLENLAAQF